jgi:flagellar biosynthesis protein FliR
MLLELSRLSVPPGQRVLLGMLLAEVILPYLEQSRTIGRNTKMKAFRQWARENIKDF